MNIKGIIFDLDGVLVFTDEYHYLAWKKIAEKLGVPFDRTVNNRLRGVSRMESLEIILEQYQGNALSQEEKTALAEEKNAYYREYLNELSRKDVTDEVRDTLRWLREKGCLLAVGSSSKNARFILDKIELLSAFDQIVDGTDISHSKPDPEVFVKAAQRLGLTPQECAVVEDARAGIDAAKAGGMLAVAIGDAVQYEKRDKAIESVADLKTLIFSNH